MKHLQRLRDFARILLQHDASIRFTIVEVGAVQVAGHVEPFYHLLDAFPGSEIIGFEVEEDLCREMNRKARKGVRYFPVALGQTEERRPFYVTKGSLCCSLYKPNQPLLELYNAFGDAYLDHVTEIETRSLDHFTAAEGIGDVDFIKIDVQGAELDVFRGGDRVLDNVIGIVSEVEFIPHYENQPLFGDVCAHLSAKGLMFHKFLGLQGRSLRPLIINNDPTFGTQHIWSDAMYVAHVQRLDALPPQKVAKLAILAHLYGSIDLTFFCLRHYDQRMGTQLYAAFQKAY